LQVHAGAPVGGGDGVGAVGATVVVVVTVGAIAASSPPVASNDAPNALPFTLRRLIARPRLVHRHAHDECDEHGDEPDLVDARQFSVPGDHPPFHRMRTIPTTPRVSAIVPPIEAMSAMKPGDRAARGI
jgi:hypothetical protein